MTDTTSTTSTTGKVPTEDALSNALSNTITPHPVHIRTTEIPSRVLAAHRRSLIKYAVATIAETVLVVLLLSNTVFSIVEVCTRSLPLVEAVAFLIGGSCSAIIAAVLEVEWA